MVDIRDEQQLDKEVNQLLPGMAGAGTGDALVDAELG